MFLRFLTIKNYRSLEDVTLDKLDHFNVLIGRNNAGKSSVFNALQLVNGVVNRSSFEYERVLTELDTGRSLEIHLTFEPRQRDREEFLDLLYTTAELRHRRDDVQNSQLMRQIEYTLKAPEGRPDYLQPHEIRVLAENGQWTTVQRIMNPGVANPSSLLTNMDTVRTQYSGYVLDSNLLSVDNAPHTNAALAIQVDLQQRDADPATLWVWTKISDYFRNAFFFNPFRHSIESAAVQQTPQLAQDGSNLPQTLHTINSNNRQTFQEIEHFIQAALPDVGVLQAPLEGTSTRVSFRRPAAGYEVQLRDMGSGIEQLLMAATVLLTTGDESTLFLERARKPPARWGAAVLNGATVQWGSPGLHIHALSNVREPVSTKEPLSRRVFERANEDRPGKRRSSVGCGARRHRRPKQRRAPQRRRLVRRGSER